MNAKLLLLLPCLLFSAACSKSDDGDPQFVYGIETRAKAGDFVYRVNRVSNQKQIGEGIISYTAEDRFMVINLMVKNDGKKEYTLTKEMITYHYDDKTAEPSDKAVILPDGFYQQLTLKANEQKTVDVVYEISRDPKLVDYLLVKAPGKSKESIKILMEKDPA